VPDPWSPPSTWKQISEAMDSPLSDKAIQLLDERDRSLSAGGGGSNTSVYTEEVNPSPEIDDGDNLTLGPFNAPVKTDGNATFLQARVELFTGSNVLPAVPMNLSIRWGVKDSGGTTRLGSTSTAAFGYAPDSGNYVTQKTGVAIADATSFGDMQGATLYLEFYTDVSPAQIWYVGAFVELSWVYDGTP